MSINHHITDKQAILTSAYINTLRTIKTINSTLAIPVSEPVEFNSIPVRIFTGDKYKDVILQSNSINRTEQSSVSSSNDTPLYTGVHNDNVTHTADVQLFDDEIHLHEQIRLIDEQIDHVQQHQYQYTRYIDALHQLNETRDTVQLMIGQLSQLTGNTISSIHEQLHLS